MSSEQRNKYKNKPVGAIAKNVSLMCRFCNGCASATIQSGHFPSCSEDINTSAVLMGGEVTTEHVRQAMPSKCIRKVQS